jgi:hypothetical protein
MGLAAAGGDKAPQPRPKGQSPRRNTRESVSTGPVARAVKHIAPGYRSADRVSGAAGGDSSDGGGWIEQTPWCVNGLGSVSYETISKEPTGVGDDNFPHRGQCFDVTFRSGHPWLLVEGPYGWLTADRSLLRSFLTTMVVETARRRRAGLAGARHVSENLGGWVSECRASRGGGRFAAARPRD